MPKVNLLPDYIWEGKRRRTLWMMVIGLLALELLALGFFYKTSQDQLAEETQQRDDWKLKADKVDQITALATQITSTIKPITDRTKYVQDILAFNRKFPALFERTNLYTYYKVRYNQLQPAQTVLNMQASTRTVGDIGRYLFNIQRAKDTFSTVTITSQMPGWPAGGADAAAGGATAPAAGANPYSAYNPYAASSLAAPATQATAGYAGSTANLGGGLGGYSGYAPAGLGPGNSLVAAAPPPQLAFSAVGQLVTKFQFSPPTFAGAAPTDGNGGTTGPATSGYGNPYATMGAGGNGGGNSAGGNN